MKKEFIFEVEQDDDMLVATCHEPEMATQGQTLDELLAMIRDLVQCRFDDGDEHLRWPIRLHFLQDPVLMLA
jgi:predicted RNase H-like HicB family nuclease